MSTPKPQSKTAGSGSGSPTGPDQLLSSPDGGAQPFSGLPGAELVTEGLADLAQERITDCALLVLIDAPRLKRLGIQVPDRQFVQPCEHLLYARLAERLGASAHSRYNSLLRRIDSFARGLERERSQPQRR